jgi:hypothetical protein
LIGHLKSVGEFVWTFRILWVTVFYFVIQVKSIFECVSSYGCNVRALISLRPTLP